MKQKIKYKNAPKDIKDSLLESEIIDDFLPPPNELIYKEDTMKITLNLSKESIDFFKLKANENGVPYQRMIKQVVDLYVHKFKKI